MLWGMGLGLAAGFLANSVGIPGPASMLVFRWLALPKDVVRSTAGVMAMINLRVLVAGGMGLLSRADWPLYVAAVGAGIVGGVIGNPLAALVDEQLYRRAIFVLLVASAGVLIGKGAASFWGVSSNE